MTEADARDYITARVSRETVHRLEQFEHLIRTEAERQNLVSRATLYNLWARHFADSLQLADLAPRGSRWADIGSGAGLPGIPIAAMLEAEVTLIEPRRLRADFLRTVIETLNLGVRCHVIHGSAQSFSSRPYDVVTARAVAALDTLLAMGRGFSDRRTLWLLPKGRAAESEVALARRAWQGEFRFVPSVTEEGSVIVVATGISPRSQR